MRNENAERYEEWRIEELHLFPVLGEVEGEIGDANYEILRKVHRHAVAEIFAGEVLKQEP
jgi:hypothetical protein